MFYLKLYCFYKNEINIEAKQIEISNVKKCFSPCINKWFAMSTKEKKKIQLAIVLNRCMLYLS